MTQLHNKDSQDIKDIINKVLKKIERKGSGSKTEVIKAWYAVIDRKTLEHTRPISVIKKILTIQVDSSAWLYTLNLQKGEILKKIRDILGNDKIYDLRFKIGELM